MDGGKRKLTGRLAALSKYRYALLAAVLGGLLLLWPTGNPAGTDTAASAEQEDSTRELEQRLESALSRIQGVGQVDVTLTMGSSSRLVLADNRTLRYSGDPDAPQEYDRTSETVTVSASGGGQEVVVTQRFCPQYRGALVVCQGGGDDGVILRVVQAVSALTGLGSDRISVAPSVQEGQS